MNETKEHIIITTSKLFLQKSFREVTMQEIVTKTGLSKGAFYHYFRSKEQVFLEVLDFVFSKIFVHDYESYSKESFYAFYHDYANAVENIGKKYLESMKDEGNKVFNISYFALIFDAIKLFPDFRENVVSGLQGEMDIWKGVIAQAKKNGEIKKVMTDEEIALTFISISDGVAMHMLVKGLAIAEVKNIYLSLWDKFYEQIKQ